MARELRAGGARISNLPVVNETQIPGGSKRSRLEVGDTAG